jgi:uncharacterized protein (TIGR02270 family)
MTHAALERSTASSAAGATRSAALRNSIPVNPIALKRALAMGEQAAFVWATRRTVVRSSAATFDLLTQLDGRLSRLVYKLSERPMLTERLLDYDHAAFKSGLTFVTAVRALRGRVVAVFDELLARLESDPELFSPLASAMAWLDYRDVDAQVNRLLASPSPSLLGLGVAASTAHHIDPGVALECALDAEVPALRALGLEAIGRLALSDFRVRLHAALADPDALCRFWAAWSAVRLGERSAIPVVGRFATDGGPFARAACDIALRALDVEQALRAQNRLLSTHGCERLAVIGAGVIGDPTLADWLVDAMANHSIARLAASSFCLMTGCDLLRNDLDSQSPPRAPEAAAPEPERIDDRQEQPLARFGSAMLGDEPDDDLPWPDPIRVRNWWDGNRHRFRPGIRYLAGVPIRPPGLSEVLQTGNQQQRAAAALELALHDPNAPLLDVTGPAHRQSGTRD